MTQKRYKPMLMPDGSVDHWDEPFIARHQYEHESINAREYPGTRQLCVICDEPTERCEEDAIYTKDGEGPLCVECWCKTPEYVLENRLAMSDTSLSPPSCSSFSVGDIVTVPIKNRLGIDCAATIEAVHADTVDATVWNMDGPGANRLVTGIPHSVCEANTHDQP